MVKRKLIMRTVEIFTYSLVLLITKATAQSSTPSSITNATTENTTLSENTTLPLTEQRTISLSDCPSQGSNVNNGAILNGTTVSCTCSSLSPNSTLMQWFSPDGDKMTEAYDNATISIQANNDAEGYYICRRWNDTSEEEHFQPVVAYGPTDSDIIVPERDAHFDLLSHSEKTISILCLVQVHAVWPFPLFRIHISFGPEEIIYHSTLESVSRTDEMFFYRHEYKPDRGGQASIKCRAFNALFPDEAYGETSYVMNIYDYRHLVFNLCCPSNNEVNENEIVTFSCTRDAVTGSVLRLKRSGNGETLRQSSSIHLEFNKTMGCDDMDRYVCEALDSVSNSSVILQEFVNVKVKCPVRIPGDYNLQNRTETFKISSEEFSISLFGYPDPQGFQLSRMIDPEWENISMSSYSVSIQRPDSMKQNVTLFLRFQNGYLAKEGLYRLLIWNGVDEEAADYRFHLQESDPESSSSDNQPAIGIVIGIIAAIAVVNLLAIYIVIRLRKAGRCKKKNEEKEEGPYTRYERNSSVDTGITFVGSLRSIPNTEGNGSAGLTARSISTDTLSSWAPSGHPYESARYLQNHYNGDVSDKTSEKAMYSEPHTYEMLPEDTLAYDSRKEERNHTPAYGPVTTQLSREDEEVGYFQPI